MTHARAPPLSAATEQPSRDGITPQGNRTLISFRSKDCIDIAEVKLLAFE